jgi:hypothetical protein
MCKCADVQMCKCEDEMLEEVISRFIPLRNFACTSRKFAMKKALKKSKNYFDTTFQQLIACGLFSFLFFFLQLL